MFWLKKLFLVFALPALSALPLPAQYTQQGPKLVATDAGTYSAQGESVAISADGNTALIGSGYGGAWVFTRESGVWTQQGPELIGTGVSGPPNCLPGWSVALSADGNTALLGGPCDGGSTTTQTSGNVGAGWIFVRSGSVWTQEGSKLVGAGAVPGFNGQSSIGASVALSADGNTAVLGGPDDNYSGATWVFTRSQGVWTQAQPKLVGSGTVTPNHPQGSSVGISADGNTLLTAAPGTVWIFVNSQGMWTEQAKIATAAAQPSPVCGGRQPKGISTPLCSGSFVSLSADGNTALVGVGDGALILTRSGTSWTVMTKLVGYGSARDPLSGGISDQGASVSLSADGKMAAVGGPEDDTVWVDEVIFFDHSSIGAAWVFQQSGGVWTQVGSKLIGSDMTGAYLYSPGIQQGSSVAVSADGTTVLSGGPGDAQVRGATWVFAIRSPSATILSASPNPSLSGRRIIFTAKVTTGATGIITFTVDGAQLAQMPLNGGSAQIATSLSSGTHRIAAEYSGDTSYLGSTSNPLNAVVRPTVPSRQPNRRPVPIR